VHVPMVGYLNYLEMFGYQVLRRAHDKWCRRCYLDIYRDAALVIEVIAQAITTLSHIILTPCRPVLDNSTPMTLNFSVLACVNIAGPLPHLENPMREPFQLVWSVNFCVAFC